jgi:hypothetical protein
MRSRPGTYPWPCLRRHALHPGREAWIHAETFAVMLRADAILEMVDMPVVGRTLAPATGSLRGQAFALSGHERISCGVFWFPNVSYRATRVKAWTVQDRALRSRDIPRRKRHFSVSLLVSISIFPRASPRRRPRAARISPAPLLNDIGGGCGNAGNSHYLCSSGKAGCIYWPAGPRTPITCHSRMTSEG